MGEPIALTIGLAQTTAPEHSLSYTSNVPRDPAPFNKRAR